YIDMYPFKSHIGTLFINHEYQFKDGWLMTCKPYYEDAKTYIAVQVDFFPKVATTMNIKSELKDQKLVNIELHDGVHYSKSDIPIEPSPMLLVKDLDLIKKIQIKDFGNFHGRGQHQVSKFNLINVDGERWKDMRSLLTPAFTSSNMKKMLPLLDICTDEFLEVLDSLHEQEKAFEIREVFQKLSLDVIVRSAFGVQSNVQKNPGTTGMNAIVKARRQDLLHLMLNAEVQEGEAVNVHQFTAGNDGEAPKSAESSMSARKHRCLSNAEVQANAVLFLVAG
ncbi:conserved hypothetical protein, partial [Ixodes scapularis]